MNMHATLLRFLWCVTPLAVPIIGMAQFYESPLATFPGLYRSASAFVDVNGDDLPDLVMAGADVNDNPHTRLFLNQGDGQFINSTVFEPLADRVWYAAIGVSDVDNDGDLDVLITGRDGFGQPTARLYVNGYQTGDFDPAWDIKVESSTGFTGVEHGSITFGNFTEDELEDVLITGGLSAIVYKNLGGYSFERVSILEGVARSSSATGHFFGSSNLDLIVAGEEANPTGRTRLYKGDGTGGFVVQDLLPGIAEGAVAVADMNRNFDLNDDVFITGFAWDGGSGERISHLYKNMGNGFELVPTEQLAGRGYSSAIFGYVDPEFYPDLIITGEVQGSIRSEWHKNNLSEGFVVPPTTIGNAVMQGTLSMADVDHDCDQDLFIMGWGTSGPIATLFLNISENFNTQYYADADGDGYGDPNSPVNVCPPPPGSVLNADDCDDGTPGIPGGYVGALCDDGNPSTVNDMYTSACICQGDPCPNVIQLKLFNTVNTDQISWEIVDQFNNTVLFSGGQPGDPYANGNTGPILETFCLEDGCYRLRVLDSGGDGFNNDGVPGGYQLRDASNRRIIDDLDHFEDGSLSQIISTHDNGAFCVPMESIKLIASHQNKLDWLDTELIQVEEDPEVTSEYGSSNSSSGYEFWFFDPDGGFSYRRFVSHANPDNWIGSPSHRARWFRINPYGLPEQLPHNLFLNVRVRARVAGNYKEFGPASRFMIDPSQSCQSTYLVTSPGGQFSCGVNKIFGGSNNPPYNKIWAQSPPIQSGTQVDFQFRFRRNGVCLTRETTTNSIFLNWNNIAPYGDAPLTCGVWEVDVRMRIDGSPWCEQNDVVPCATPFTQWGPICTVNITSDCATGGGQNNMPTQPFGEVTIYPNPNHGDQFMINIADLPRDIETVDLDLFDLNGKRVVAKRLAAQDGHLNTAVDLKGTLAEGIYMARCTAGDQIFTQRVVVQH